MAKAEVRVDVLQQYWYEPVCVKTGRPVEKWVKHPFNYVPPWVYLFLLGGLIPLIIVYMIVRKQAIVYFPTSKGIQAKRNLVTLITTLCILAGAGFLLAGFADVMWAVLGAVLLAAGAILGTVGVSRVWVTGSLDKEAQILKLNGLHEEFALRVTHPQIPEAPPPSPTLPPPP